MPRDAVSRTINVERNGGHKWVKVCDSVDDQQTVFDLVKIKIPVPATVLRVTRIYYSSGGRT